MRCRPRREGGSLRAELVSVASPSPSALLASTRERHLRRQARCSTVAACSARRSEKEEEGLQSVDVGEEQRLEEAEALHLRFVRASGVAVGYSMTAACGRRGTSAIVTRKM